MGAFRLLLATMVVIAHLTEGTAQTSHFGVFAVFGFYTVSGLLITRALNESYKFNFTAFWSNRALRLFPMYYAACIAGLVLISVNPDAAARFLPTAWIATPALPDWGGIATIAPTGIGSWSFRPVPSIWSVGVELINYALLFAFTARRASYATTTLVIALGFHFMSLANGDPWVMRYAPAHAATLPFSIGALIYFALKVDHMRVPTRGLEATAGAWGCVVALTALTGGIRPEPAFNVLFYANLLTIAALTAAIASRPLGNRGALDKWLGDLSYPVFLTHWIVGFALAELFFSGQTRGFVLAGVTLVGSLIAAWSMCHAQDRLVEPWRQRVRRRLLDNATSPVNEGGMHDHEQKPGEGPKHMAATRAAAA